MIIWFKLNCQIVKNDKRCKNEKQKTASYKK
jgi:hypothetical protein